MQLTVREAARLLQVDEDVVYRWIRQRGLPAAKFGEHVRLNRVELVEWAHRHRVPLRQHSVTPDPRPLPSLVAALREGGVHRDLPGSTKREVLSAAVDRLRLPSGSDRDLLHRMLLAREDQGSTGFGEGIAIPHVRNPVVLAVQEPLVSLFFLAEPVDFQAVDGEPVFALFLLVTPNVRSHLHLLSRLSTLLRSPQLSQLLARRAPDAELLAQMEELEQALVTPVARDEGEPGSTR